MLIEDLQFLFLEKRRSEKLQQLPDKLADGFFKIDIQEFQLRLGQGRKLVKNERNQEFWEKIIQK